MKKTILFILILSAAFINAQIANYNQYPTLYPPDGLDEKLSDISFAYSLRKLYSDYDGPIIRLRKADNNAEMDFYSTDSDLVDIATINTWRNGASVFVDTWYDQSGQNRNATQNIKNRQPRFIPDDSQPYFVGDGSNDILLVQENFQVLTENGKNGSVLGVFYGTDRADSAFGVISGRERWLTHINWSNERCYFDPGYCCNGPRSFVNNVPTHPSNPGSLTIWDQYTFVRRDDPTNAATDRIIMRLGGEQKVNGGFPNNQSCNLTFNFGICATTRNAGGSGTGFSTTRFSEIIMYSNGKEDSFLEDIEQDQINFWGL